MADNEFMLLLHEVLDAANELWPKLNNFELLSEIKERLETVMNERE